MRRSGLKATNLDATVLVSKGCYEEHEGVRIYCGYTRLADTSKLKPHPKAFRDHSKAQRAIIGDIIESAGWREPVTVSKRTGVVTRGWARVLAARDKGWSAVPVDEQNYKDSAAELADAVADTKIQELSKLDGDKLRDIVVRLQKADFDLKLTGLDESVVDAILTDYERKLQLEIAPTAEGGEQGIRQVILVYDDARYAEFTAAIAVIEKKRKFESLSELCLELLRERNEVDNARQETSGHAGVRAEGST